MKILLPTAKELNLQAQQVPAAVLSPETESLIHQLAQLTVPELADFYKISEERAAGEYQAIQALNEGQASSYPALHLFDGLMYRNIRRQGWTEQEQAYIEDHVLITSALYGVIPALAPIAPHRLDFLMPLKPGGKSLKAFWKSAYDVALADEEVILSLLSSEFETVFSKSIRDRMLTFKFLEDREGQLKVHSTISKKARGQFLTALMEGQIEDLKALKSLTFAGFSYRPDLSSPQELVYVKTV